MSDNVQKTKRLTSEEIEKKRIEKLNRVELKRLEGQYRIRKKVATQEDRLDYEGEEEVLTIGRQALFELLKKQFQLGKLIPEKDITLIKNTFYTHPEFIDKEKIKFIIDVASKQSGLSKVEEVSNEFFSLLRDTQYYKPLLEFRKWVSMKKTATKINQLMQKGASSTEIAEKLHVSTAEVKVFAEKTQTMPEIFGDQER